jgi:hypothetical protein
VVQFGGQPTRGPPRSGKDGECSRPIAGGEPPGALYRRGDRFAVHTQGGRNYGAGGGGCGTFIVHMN